MSLHTHPTTFLFTIMLISLLLLMLILITKICLMMKKSFRKSIK